MEENKSRRNISSEVDYSDPSSMRKQLTNQWFSDLKHFTNCKIKEKSQWNGYASSKF